MRTAASRRMDTYVALGSSSTCGTGSSDPETKGYVALLARALDAHFPDLETHNLGLSGGCMQDILQRWDEVARLRPSIVTVLPFTDYAKTPIEEFSVHARAFMEAAHALSEERIREGGLCHVFFGDLRIDPTFVAGANEKTDGPAYRPSDFAMLSAKNEVVEAMVAHNPAISVVPVIDQNAVHPEWVGAGGHPNDLGHGYLAGCFRKTIERWWDELG